MEKITKTPQASAYSYETSDRCYSAEKKSPSEARQEVDLCLVSSCEYKHPKTELSPSFINPNPLEWFASEESTEESRSPSLSQGEPHHLQEESNKADSVMKPLPPQSVSQPPPRLTPMCPQKRKNAPPSQLMQISTLKMSLKRSPQIKQSHTNTWTHLQPPCKTAALLHAILM